MLIFALKHDLIQTSVNSCIRKPPFHSKFPDFMVTLFTQSALLPRQAIVLLCASIVLPCATTVFPNDAESYFSAQLYL